MDGFSGAYGREKDLPSRRNDEQDDYYSAAPAPRGGMGLPAGAGAGMSAGAGMAGVGALRREASSGRETLSRETSGRTEVERRESENDGDFYGGGMLDPSRGLMGGNDGGYGVASQLAPRQSNSYRQLHEQQQRQPQAYGNAPQRQYSNQFSNSSHRVSPPSNSSHRVSPPSISPLPSPSMHATAYQAPLAARQFEQAQNQQQQQAPIPRGDAASPTPSHRSLPGLNALWDTEEEPEPPRGPLRAVNRESTDVEDDFEQRRFAGEGGNDAYSGLTAGLSR